MISKPRKRILIYIALLFAGFLLYISPQIIDPILRPNEADKAALEKYLKSPTHFWIEQAKHPLELLGSVFMIGPLAIICLVSVVEHTWHSFLKEETESVRKDMATHIDAVARSINDYTGKHQHLHLIEKEISEHLYGDLCFVTDDSLYHYIKNNLLIPFCKTPHRSKMKKNIEISASQDPKYFDWHEETEYSIHHPYYKPGDGFTSYPLYWSASIMTNKESEHSVSIKVDGVEQVSAKPKDEAPNNSSEGFYKYSKGEWTTYVFITKIPLRDGITKVTIVEDTLSSIEDNTFTASLDEPAYGYSISITIPPDYSFHDDMPACSVLYLYEGVSERINAASSRDEVCKCTPGFKRRKNEVLDIEANGWLLPGIAFNVRWQKKQEGAPS